MATAPSVTIASIIGQLSPADRRAYSVRKAIARQLDGRKDELCLEREVSDLIAKQLGRTSGGFFVPTSLQRSALDTKTGAAGGYTVATDVAADIIDLLRPKSLVLRLGGQFLPGLREPISFAVKLSGITVAWVGENSGTDMAESEPVFGQRAMVGKIAQATTAFSHKLLTQSSPNVELMIRNELAAAHAEALDLAAVQGAGTAHTPLGLLKTSGIGDVVDAGGNGSVPDWEDILDLENTVAKSNGDGAAMAYLSTPDIRKLLKKTARATGSSVMIWEGNQVNGYPAAVTNHVPSTLTAGSASDCHAIIFGDFAQIVVADWGALEVIADPATLSRRGLVEVTSFQIADVLLRQPAAFAAKQDAKLS